MPTYQGINHVNHRIIIIPDFLGSGGTLTYFKQLLELLSKCPLLQIEVLLKKHQLGIAQQFLSECGSRVIWSTYLLPEFRVSQFVGSRFSYLLEVAARSLFWLYYCVTRRPSLVIHSTGGKLHYPLFILPIKVLAIQHSPQTSPLNRLDQAILNRFLGKTKRILTVSNFSKNLIVRNSGISLDKNVYVSYIYNYHSSAKIIPSEPRSKITILTIGHVVEYKNPKFWLEVAKIINAIYTDNVCFIWAGSGPLLEYYQERTASFNNIKFLGHRNNVDALYSNCDIYFQPSLIESHGIAVLGAMAHAVPCVVSDVGGLPESVVNSETGFIYNSQDLESACDKIISLIENNSLRCFLGKNGESRFTRFFSHRRWKIDMEYLLQSAYDIKC